MHANGSVLPADVHITRHAVEQLLIRFPEDLLPRDPQGYLRQLIHSAVPAPHRIARRYHTHSGQPGTRTLKANRWVLILAPNRQAPPQWSLVTVTRVSAVETNVPRELREDRLRNHETFRNGQAAALLHALANDAGTTDPNTLGRLWYEHRYPLVLHGGFETFRAFCRAVLGMARPSPAALVIAPAARTTGYAMQVPISEVTR